MRISEEKLVSMQKSLDKIKTLNSEVEQLKKSKEIIGGESFSMLLRSGNYMVSGTPALSELITFLESDEKFKTDLKEIIEKAISRKQFEADMVEVK